VSFQQTFAKVTAPARQSGLTLTRHGGGSTDKTPSPTPPTQIVLKFPTACIAGVRDGQAPDRSRQSSGPKPSSSARPIPWLPYPEPFPCFPHHPHGSSPCKVRPFRKGLVGVRCAQPYLPGLTGAAFKPTSSGPHRVHGLNDQGLSRDNPSISSKSRVFRVARIKPCARAMAAICASSTVMGRPCRVRWATIRA